MAVINTITVPVNVEVTAIARGWDRALDHDRELEELLHGIHIVCGDAVHAPLQTALAKVRDSMTDVKRDLERVVAQLTSQLANERDEHRTYVRDLMDERKVTGQAQDDRISRLTMLLRFATDDVVDRYKRSRRERPAWLEDAIDEIDPPVLMSAALKILGWVVMSGLVGIAVVGAVLWWITTGLPDVEPVDMGDDD